MTKARDLSQVPNASLGFKNRIINGAMMIDQRNAGASVSLNNAFLYTLDRWGADEQTDGAFTVQQSSVAPTGFTNSLLVTTTTADSSLGASQYAYLLQAIEGFNCADLGFGTANASTVTLSFWVRSSLTGTFGGAIRNYGSNRAYPFTYTINSANTWEQKAITIAGDTTGTWLTNNSGGLVLAFGLGVGSSFSATAGSWTAGNILSATGATNVLGTLNATWQVTAVQLEKGSTATSFDYRPYGTELALCQRYYDTGEHTTGIGSAIFTAVKFTVPMRASPTVTRTGNGSITGGTANSFIDQVDSKRFYFGLTSAQTWIGGSYNASAEL